MKKRSIGALWLAAAFALGVSCGSNVVDNGGKNGCDGGNCGGPWKIDAGWTPQSACSDGADGLDIPKRDAADLGLFYAVTVAYNNGDAPDIGIFDEGAGWVETEVSGEHVILRSSLTTTEINIVLSGTAKNGSLKVYAGHKISLYLNGADITNPKGPAINIQNGTKINTVSVYLLGGCERINFLADGPNYDMSLVPSNEKAKGLFFAEPNVVFDGGGTLELRSKHNHAIVVDNSINIKNGHIIIHESKNDGIHANDLITVSGGDIQIKSVGDAIQSENEQGRTIPGIRIGGGRITARTTGIKSHGIASERDVEISGNADIKITVTGNGSKGIRTRENAIISGGTINVQTAGNLAASLPGEGDDPSDTTSSAAGIKAVGFQMTAGQYTALSTGENSKGINVDNNAVISGGNIDIRAFGDGMKIGGDLTVSGGKVRTESATKKGVDCKGTIIIYDNNAVTRIGNGKDEEKAGTGF